jgi:imidazolonepropionase-like amidohydrolase
MNIKLVIIFLFSAKIIFSQSLILKNVNVIPINQEITIRGCNVYIRNGKIERITPYPEKKEPGKKRMRKEPTAGYTVIDCKGGYLMPGLADMHTHFPGKDSPINLQEFLRLNLAAGVTTLRSMRGEYKQLALRDSINKGIKKNSPEIYVSYVFPATDSLLSKDSIEKIVSYAVNYKFDFIKYLDGINETNINYLIESCKRHDLPVAGHAYGKSLSKSIGLNFASVEHFQPMLSAFMKDSLNFKKTVDSMKTKKISFCPTLSFYYIYAFNFSQKDLSDRNGMNYIREPVRKTWLTEYNEALENTRGRLKQDFEARFVEAYRQTFLKFGKILKYISDNGVNVLLSPDDCIFNVPGFSMYEEMKLYKNAGLSNYQVLKCATLNAAKYFKAEKIWGSIEIGKKANMVLLNANPLENIENIKQIEGTLLNGKYYLKTDLVKENK